MKKNVLTGLLLSIFVGISGLGKQHAFASSSSAAQISNIWIGFQGLANKRMAKLTERIAGLDVVCSYVKKIGEDIKEKNEKNKMLKVSNLFKDYVAQYKEEVAKTIEDWERFRAEANSKKTGAAIRKAIKNLEEHWTEILIIDKMDNDMVWIIREALAVLVNQMKGDCYSFMINDLTNLQGKISARVANVDTYKSEICLLLDKVNDLYKEVSCESDFLEKTCKNGIERIKPVLNEIYNPDYTLNKLYDIQMRKFSTLESEWKELDREIGKYLQHTFLVNGGKRRKQ